MDAQNIIFGHYSHLRCMVMTTIMDYLINVGGAICMFAECKFITTCVFTVLCESSIIGAAMTESIIWTITHAIISLTLGDADFLFTENIGGSRFA